MGTGQVAIVRQIQLNPGPGGGVTYNSFANLSDDNIVRILTLAVNANVTTDSRFTLRIIPSVGTVQQATFFQFDFLAAAGSEFAVMPYAPLIIPPRTDFFVAQTSGQAAGTVSVVVEGILQRVPLGTSLNL